MDQNQEQRGFYHSGGCLGIYSVFHFLDSVQEVCVPSQDRQHIKLLLDESLQPGPATFFFGSKLTYVSFAPAVNKLRPTTPQHVAPASILYCLAKDPAHIVKIPYSNPSALPLPHPDGRLDSLTIIKNHSHTTQSSKCTKTLFQPLCPLLHKHERI